MKKFIVEGGLGRLSQFPKQVEVLAKDSRTAEAIGHAEIRRLITLELGENDPMLNKIISIDDVREA